MRLKLRDDSVLIVWLKMVETCRSPKAEARASPPEKLLRPGLTPFAVDFDIHEGSRSGDRC